MAPDFDHLTLMQKVEVFEHALENTTGDDLAKILWYKSQSSDVCFIIKHYFYNILMITIHIIILTCLIIKYCSINIKK